MIFISGSWLLLTLRPKLRISVAELQPLAIAVAASHTVWLLRETMQKPDYGLSLYVVGNVMHGCANVIVMLHAAFASFSAKEGSGPSRWISP